MLHRPFKSTQRLTTMHAASWTNTEWTGPICSLNVPRLMQSYNSLLVTSEAALREGWLILELVRDHSSAVSVPDSARPSVCAACTSFGGINIILERSACHDAEHHSTGNSREAYRPVWSAQLAFVSAFWILWGQPTRAIHTPPTLCTVTVAGCTCCQAT